MANLIEVDVETLLAPISADAPSGVFLRYEGTYERIREARREDDASLPQGVWERALKSADWASVISISMDALTRKTKDVQIAVWLGEAWVHQGGVGGLRQTIALIRGLCDRFWDTCFPVLEDGDTEARMNLIDWLDDVAARDLRQIPLTEASGSSAGYCLADWEAGLQVGTAGARSRALSGDGVAAVTHESFLARLSMTGYVRWAAMKKELDATFAAVTDLETLLVVKVPGASVLRRTGSTLRSIAVIVEEGLKVTADDAPPGVVAASGLAGLLGLGGGGGTTGAGRSSALSLEAGSGGAGGGIGGAGSFTSAGGPITSRTDAYVRLVEAADYLLRTEPHSPVPYLVKRAISWGNMSLAELLYEFVGNTDDLVAIQRLLGMRERE